MTLSAYLISSSITRYELCKVCPTTSPSLNQAGIVPQYRHAILWRPPNSPPPPTTTKREGSWFGRAAMAGSFEVRVGDKVLPPVLEHKTILHSGALYQVRLFLFLCLLSLSDLYVYCSYIYTLGKRRINTLSLSL